MDVATGEIRFSDGQISGNVIAGGIARVDIAGTADLVKDGVYRRDFTAGNTILKADLAGSPVALEIPEGTILGRLPGTDTTLQPLTAHVTTTFLNVLRRDVFSEDNTIVKADHAGNPVPLTLPAETMVGRTEDGPIRAMSIDEVKNMLEVETTTPQVLYREGALMRVGRTAEFPNGGSMTGLLFTSSERFHMATGERIRALNVDVETSYISCDFLRTGGRVAPCKLGQGYADGHRKVIILSGLAEKAFLQVSCSLIAPGTPDPCGFIFYETGQTAILQWDSYLMKWLIVGGAGAEVVTPDDLAAPNYFENFFDNLMKRDL